MRNVSNGLGKSIGLLTCRKIACAILALSKCRSQVLLAASSYFGRQGPVSGTILGVASVVTS